MGNRKVELTNEMIDELGIIDATIIINISANHLEDINTRKDSFFYDLRTDEIFQKSFIYLMSILGIWSMNLCGMPQKIVKSTINAYVGEFGYPKSFNNILDEITKKYYDKYITSGPEGLQTIMEIVVLELVDDDYFAQNLDRLSLGTMEIENIFGTFNRFHTGSLEALVGDNIDLDSLRVK